MIRKEKKTNPENIMFITFKEKKNNWYITMIYLYEKQKLLRVLHKQKKNNNKTHKHTQEKGKYRSKWKKTQEKKSEKNAKVKMFIYR